MSSLSDRAPRRWRLARGVALPEDVWQTRHRWVTSILAAHLPLLTAYAVYRDQPAAVADGVAAGLVLLAVARAATLSRGRVVPPRWLASCAASLGLMTCAFTLVSVSGGAIETHFHFFVLVPVIALYEAWPPFLLAVVAVLVEHGVVGMLLPEKVYGHDAMHMDHPWQFAVVHASFFALACIGSVVTWSLAEQARVAQQGLIEELAHRALHDSLTGLPNWSGLTEAVDAALADPQTRSLAVVVMDLDRFAEVNDTLGHSAGDQLLGLVGPLLQSAVDGRGVLARLGGDEFGVLLTGVDDGTALRIAHELLAALDASFTVGGVKVSVGASAGVAVHVLFTPGALAGADATTERSALAENLLRQADVAMYAAKGSGRGVELYDASTDENSTQRLGTLNELRLALDAEDEIVLHFQPKIHLADQRLHGVEALVRWQHPARGLVPPSAFVELAQSTDLAAAFTGRVLSLALAQCARWVAAGRHVPVAVNISPRCLVRDGFVPSVVALLDQHRVPADLLKIEITEEAVVGDPETAIDVLGALRALGVRTSIDDFGTGFSSLSYLRRMPIDELKIDRSFVTGLGLPTDDQAGGSPAGADEVLVSSIIELGHRLGLHVVAEGVEEQHELDALERLGCDTVQGYFYSRPVPAADIPAAMLRTTAVPVQPGPVVASSAQPA